MPIQPMYFQPLSFQQANPLGAGMQQGSEIASNMFSNQLKRLQAQQMGIQNQVLPQSLQAQLQQLQTNNQYLPQTLQSDIGLKNAQAGLMGTEAGKNQFYLNNPALMLPGMAGQVAGAYMLPGMMPQTSPPPVNINQQTAPQASGIPADIARPQQVPSQMPANLPISNGNYPTLPGGLTPQQGNNIANQLNAATGTPAPQSTGNPLVDQMMRMMFLPQQKDMAQMQYYASRASAYNNLTPDQKNQVLAQANAFGYDQTQAGQLLQSGKTLTDLATDKGFDANQGAWPDPIYAPTSAGRSLINRRQSSLAELNTLGPQLTQALAPYSQRIANYSPSQIADAISGDNPDQQARFLAAKALMPEYSALRLKVMQGQVGIEAIKEVQNASMGNIKSFQSLVTPEVYTKANQYMDQWLNQATGAANKVSSTGRMPDAQTLTNSLSGANAVGTPSQGGAPASITASLGGKNYVKINGSWYQQ
jgi:hypothetical protein